MIRENCYNESTPENNQDCNGSKDDKEWTISVWTLAPIDVGARTYRDLVGGLGREVARTELLKVQGT